MPSWKKLVEVKGIKCEDGHIYILLEEWEEKKALPGCRKNAKKKKKINQQISWDPAEDVYNTMPEYLEAFLSRPKNIHWAAPLMDQLKREDGKIIRKSDNNQKFKYEHRATLEEIVHRHDEELKDAAKAAAAAEAEALALVSVDSLRWLACVMSKVNRNLTHCSRSTSFLR